MTTTQQNVPVLRFKDEQGNDFPDWREKRLGEICSTFKSGNGITMSRIAATGDYPVYGGNGLRGYTDSFTHEGYFMLIGRQGALCGNINRSKGRAYVSEHAIAVQANNDNDTEWLAQKLDFYNLNRFSESSAQPGLSVSRLIRFKLFVPDLTEQQKIATFLSSVDTKIEQLNNKKALWEQYKKGMMQKLFSQEIRFKDEQGNDYPDWEEKELGDVLDYKQPTDYQVKSTEYDNSYKIPVLTAGKTFLLGFTNEATGIFKNILPIIIFDDFTTAFKFVDFPFKVKSSAMKILIPTNSNVNIKFVYEAMGTICFPLGEHKRYWISEYQKEKIAYPDEREQQKIATFLSAIDQKIELITTELKQARTFKKGLLQQMFI